MSRKILKLIKQPKRYVPLAAKTLQRRLCRLFQPTAFFLQGQMDINPKSLWHRPDFTFRTGGFFPKPEEAARRVILDLAPWDNTRRDMLILLLRSIIERKVGGDFAEVGVYRGLTARLIHHYAPERRLHLFDTFAGFGRRGAGAEKQSSGHTVAEAHYADTSLDDAAELISPLNDNVLLHKGYFPDSIPSKLADARFAFVHLDADLYEPTFEGLKFFYPRMSRGGFIVIHDYNAWPGSRKAVDDFFRDAPEIPVPMPDKSGSAVITKL